MHVTTHPNKNRQSYSKMSSSQVDRITDLQLQLKEARAHIDYLKGANQNLLNQVSLYEHKCDEMKLMEEELEFRKQQEKQMQEHLDNYHQINEKLRERVNELEHKLKQKTHADSYFQKHRTEQDTSSIKKYRKQLAVFDENASTRRSLSGNTQKENHPITPKARVNLNINAYFDGQICSLKVPQSKRVFL